MQKRPLQLLTFHTISVSTLRSYVQESSRLSTSYTCRCPCDRELARCFKSVKTRVSNALGKTFFNIAGMMCYQYDHPVRHCVEYVEPPRHRLPPWILRATKANTFKKIRTVIFSPKLDLNIHSFLEIMFYWNHDSTLIVFSLPQANKDPHAPRCRRYELDRTKPKAWQFFQTVYDESNHRSEMPRSMRNRPHRRPPLSVFQKLLTDFFLRVVDPS